MEEIWKPVVGFERLYEVSDQGSVRAKFKLADLDLLAGGRLLKLYVDTQARPCVSLRLKGITKTRRVSTLVAGAFIGPCPDGHEVCHNDGNPANNCVSNLRYDTHNSNMLDASRHGTIGRGVVAGESHGRSTLTESDVLEIRRLRDSGIQGKELAIRFGTTPTNISRICNRTTWRHL